MRNAAASKTQAIKSESEGKWLPPIEANQTNDDMRTTKHVQITQPSKRSGPNLIEDDSPTRNSTQAISCQKLLAAVDISGRNPTPRPILPDPC